MILAIGNNSLLTRKAGMGVRKLPAFVCCLLLSCLLSACGSDNDDTVIHNRPDNPFREATFTKLSDGSYTYDGQCSSGKGAYGHGWKLEEAYVIGDDGHIKENTSSDLLMSEVLVFDKDGSKLMEYHPGENLKKYSAHGMKVTSSGWYSFNSRSADGRWGDTQLISCSYNDDGAGRTQLVVVGPLYLTSSDERVYGLKYYTALDDEQTAAIRNGLKEEVPNDCKFRVKITSERYAGPMGDKIFFAPFELMHFKLTDWTDMESLQNPAFTYYDSITWRRGDNVGGTLKLCSKESSKEGMKISTTSEWSNYFYDRDLVGIFVEGWKHGEVVYTYNLDLAFRQRDFLCYDWTDKVGTPDKVGTGIYNVFMPNEQYNLYPPRYDKDGHLYARVYTWADKGMAASDECEQLYNLLRRYYPSVSKIRAEKVDKARSFFHCLPDGDTPVYYVDQWGSRIAIVLAKGDEDFGTPDQYYIHAEPSDTK